MISGTDIKQLKLKGYISFVGYSYPTQWEQYFRKFIWFGSS